MKPLLALSLATIALAQLAAAQPPYVPAQGEEWIGPRPQGPCGSQSLGHGGDASGSGGASPGDHGYHSYANDHTIGLVDACVGLDASRPLEFLDCKIDRFEGGLYPGLEDVVEGATTQDPGLVVAGSITILDAALGIVPWNLPDPCGEMLDLGFGTDGEFEYGSNAAALNVRVGAVPGKGGDGIDGCLGGVATAHHANDVAVYVQDAVSGGAVGFTLAADWARPAEVSVTGEDENEVELARHCGDGAIEPCSSAAAYPGWEGDINRGNLPTALPAPTSSEDLAEGLDTVFGCNPLDVVGHQDVPPQGIAVHRFDPPGATLAEFGDGGAAGWLYVFLDEGSGARACYDLEDGACPGDLAVYHSTRVSAPTVGWIWTGA